MLHVIYKKDTKQIQLTREEISPSTTEFSQIFVNFCKDNNFAESDLNFAKIEKPDFVVSCGYNHIYDEQSNAVIVDPDYIPPPSVEVKPIPVSDPGADIVVNPEEVSNV